MIRYNLYDPKRKRIVELYGRYWTNEQKLKTALKQVIDGLKEMRKLRENRNLDKTRPTKAIESQLNYYQRLHVIQVEIKMIGVFNESKTR